MMSPRTEALIRLAAFGGILLIMMLAEVIAPRRLLTVHKGFRWSSNLGLMVLNTIVQRLVIPLSAAGCAMYAQSRSWGLCHWLAWPAWMEFVLAFVLLDFAIYWQHVLFHRMPILWRLHKVHHADLDLDVTSGLRFHTLEMLISALCKLAVIVALGPSVLAVVTFEVVLNAMSMFNHSNVRLSRIVDVSLRWFVVTPDMHRVHHSIQADESNCNFGFNLSCWDFWLGTYLDQPAAGHDAMTLGIPDCRTPQIANRLDGMLLMPFRKKVPGQPSPD